MILKYKARLAFGLMCIGWFRIHVLSHAYNHFNVLDV